MVKYPTKESRKDIILESHNLGHFGVNATLDRLNKRFYWKGMSSDVESALKRCGTCQRQKRVPTIHHEAIGIECDNIWDSLVLDCSWFSPDKTRWLSWSFSNNGPNFKIPFRLPA
jgi:hypothetical protein